MFAGESRDAVDLDAQRAHGHMASARQAFVHLSKGVTVMIIELGRVSKETMGINLPFEDEVGQPGP
jgi:hypothetical protein